MPKGIVSFTKCQSCNEMHEITDTTDYVKCQKCGKLHELTKTSRKFTVIHGNITMGMHGGLVGNNLNEEDKVTKISAFCFPDCLAAVLGIRTLEDVLSEQKEGPWPTGIPNRPCPTEIPDPRTITGEASLS
jgi:hypothetical protein